MNLVVDTSVWSLVLRRPRVDEADPFVRAFRAHIEAGDGIFLVGNILQELLDGVRAKKDFGLRGLLIGDVDMDSSPAATPSKVHGNGNGHGNGHGNGNGHKAPRTQSALPPGRHDGMQWQQAQFKVRCPDCQGELRFNEGCMTCEACGFSKC